MSDRSLDEALALYAPSGDESSPHVKRSPFKFLDPYGSDDAALFFGRDDEVRELRARLSMSRLLVVYGESGAGKSSLLQCGLRNAIPAEEADFVFARLEHEPTPGLVRAVSAGTGSSASSLAEVLAERSRMSWRTTVLVIDQAEELFTVLGEPARIALADALAEVMRAKLDARVILSLREEYFGRLADLEPRLPELFAHRFWLPRMTAGAAIQVIEGPCARHGIALEAGLAARVTERLQDARRELDLPYLQIVLDKLWRKANASTTRRITLADLDALGPLDDVLGGYLAEQVAAQPDASLARFVLKQFVSLERTRRANDRESVTRAAVAADLGDAAAVATSLQRLVDVRILRETEAGFELRHDSLAKSIATWFTPLDDLELQLRALVAGRVAEHAASGAVIDDEVLLDKVERALPRLGAGAGAAELVTASRSALRARKWRRRAAAASVAVALFAATFALALYRDGQWRHEASLRAHAETQRQRAERAERDARAASSRAIALAAEASALATRASVASASASARAADLMREKVEHVPYLLASAFSHDGATLSKLWAPSVDYRETGTLPRDKLGQEIARDFVKYPKRNFALDKPPQPERLPSGGWSVDCSLTYTLMDAQGNAITDRLRMRLLINPQLEIESVKDLHP